VLPRWKTESVAAPARDDSPRRRWLEGRGIDALMAARNRRLVEAAAVELVERGGRTFTLRRLPAMPPPDPRLEPRPIALRVDSFPSLA
jgi:hypothetical protein